MQPAQPRSEPPPRHQTLPRGRHGLPRAFVIRNQRERLLDSMAEMVSSVGYHTLTVTDVTTHAGVSRRTFYDLFTDKEACFLAAYEWCVDRLLDRVLAAYVEGEHSWPERARAGLDALLDYCVKEPAFTRMIIVEVLAAGPTALQRRDTVLAQFTRFFQPGVSHLPPELQDLDLLPRSVVGGLYEILYQRVLNNETEQLPEILPDLVFCALVPFVGYERALAESDAARGEARETADETG